MNRKRIISSIAVIAVIASLVVALPIVGTESNHKNETLLTIEVNIMNNNLDIRRAKDDYSIAEYKDKEAEDNKGSGSGTIEWKKSNDYYPVEAEMNLDYAKWSLNELRQTKVLEGVELFYDYKYLQDEIVLVQNKLERLEKVLSEVNTKIELGTATLNDRTTAELDIKKVEYDLQVLINDRDRLFLDMNVLMGNDLDTELVFEYEPLSVEEYTSESVDADVANVLETNGDLVKLGEQGDLASIELKIYRDSNSGGKYDSTITSKKVTVTNLNNDYKDKKQSLEYDVRSKYNELLNSYDSFVIKELEIENLQLTLDVVTKRHSVGLETQSAVDAAQENLDFAQLAYDKAELDYYVAVESYKNFID